MKRLFSRAAMACSVSALTLIVGVPSVMAQAAPDDSASQDTAKTKPDSTLVIVTARRKALENATEIKRRADTVVDAVVADEAG